MGNYVRKLNREQVLELLKSGKTIGEISSEHDISKNAVYAHVRRLSQLGEWNSKSTKVKAKSISKVEVNPDMLLDSFLRRIEKVIDLETENEMLKSENYKLKNQLAATKNELVVAKDDLDKKAELSERMRKISARINKEQLDLCVDAD